MKNSLLLIFWILSTYVFAQNIEWAHTIGGTGRDQPQSIASDQDGNVIIAGTFVGTPIEFSDSDIVLHGSDSTDIYLYKKSPSGALLWATVLFSQGHDHVNDIGVDNEGNVFIVGWFRKPISMGTGNNAVTLTSAGRKDAFVAKYSPEGQLLLAYPIGSTGNDELFTASFDHEDNLVLTGRFFSDVDFDFSETTYIESCNGLVFLTLTTDLELISLFNLNNKYVYPTAVIYTPTGEMLIAGRHQAVITLPTGGVVWHASESPDGGFVLKLDNNNELLWSISIGGPLFQMVNDMKLSQNGDVYIAGGFTKTTTFYGSTESYIFQSDSESPDVFFAKLSSEGAFDWINVIGGPAFDDVTGLELDGNGHLVLVGRYYDTMDFDPSLATVTLTPQGNASSYVAMYTTNGEYISAHSFQNSSYNSASGIAISPSNELFVTGWFTESINLDPTQSGFSFYSKGVQDTYLVKMSAISVGLDENAYKPEISIFPNPAATQVKIKAEGLNKVECYDIHGRLVLSESPGFRQDGHTIGVSHLPAGIYFIRLSGNNQPAYTEKLLIVR